MKRTMGFTLIELVATVAVLAILIAVAVPSFQSMVRKNAVVNAANTLLSVLTLARSEAVRRNGSMVVCKTTSATGCSGASTWDQGAIVFVDANSNGAYDTGEVIVRVEVPVTTSGTFSVTNGTNVDFSSSVAFRSDGSVSGCSSGSSCGETSFTVQSGGSVCSRQVTVNPMTGQVKVSVPTASTSCPNI